MLSLPLLVLILTGASRWLRATQTRSRQRRRLSLNRVLYWSAPDLLRCRADCCSVAAEQIADARHDLFTESRHRALEHVVWHCAELEDQREAHQVELPSDAQNGFRDRFRAAN